MLEGGCHNMSWAKNNYLVLWATVGKRIESALLEDLLYMLQMGKESPSESIAVLQ